MRIYYGWERALTGKSVRSYLITQARYMVECAIRADKKGSDSWYILRIGPTGFTDPLNLEGEGKREVLTICKALGLKAKRIALSSTYKG